MTSGDILSISDHIADAAQKVLDEWHQDENGEDVELGRGGACDLVADRIIETIQERLGDIECVAQWNETDTHTAVVAQLADGVFLIDIPAGTYETGAGYVWRKIKGALVGASDVIVMRLDPDPARYPMYIEQ